MSTDEGPDDTRLTEIRLELKRWEAEFAAANGGRKAGREDIKNDATIAAKYQEYKDLRRKPTLKQSTPEKPANEPRKALRERSSNAISTTPRKEAKHTEVVQSLQPPAAVEEEPTPACIRCNLGPTPQKDGEVLGIFDILPAGTPSKGGAISVVASENVIGATPSKPTASSSQLNLSRTPQSSSKRFYLEAFAGTPLKRKLNDDGGYTPSTAKRQFATPSFLRRSFPLARIDEDTHESVSAGPPFKKRGLVRSLSTIVQGLKKQEEDSMDEDWDIMNELEAEERGEKASKLVVEDSQAADMPLGPDQGVDLSGEASEADPGALDANGKPRKVWKKKGLKRQTKRVKMRPVTHKAKKVTDVEHSDSENSAPDVVEETQLQPQPDRSSAGNEHELGNETEGSDYQHDSHQERAQKRSRKQKKPNPKDDKGKKSEAQDGDATKKPKKVNALAHTNFRKLKIKNKNSKANGRGKKFGRR